MAVSNKDNPRAGHPVEQATAAPGEKRSTVKPGSDTQDRGNPGSEPEQPQRPGGVDGAADQAEARERMQPAPVNVSGGPKVRVSESADPAVHQLMAERETARLNGDDKAAKAVDDRLAELGYESR
jgi:hypothetical protein